MKKRFLYLIMVSFCVIIGTINAQNRIVDGNNINIKDAPWQAAIKTKGDFNGGGSIIANNIILTADHVIDKCTPSDIQVGVGSSQFSNITDWYDVKEIISHPSLDIALLILSSPLYFNTNIKAIDILSSNNPSYYNVGNTVQVTGWGLTFLVSDDPFKEWKMSNDLKAIKLPIVSNSTINASNSFVVTYDGKSSPSKGDSGGALTTWDPAIKSHIILGTVHGNPSTKRAYCAYVKSSFFLDFLLPHYPVYITGGSDQVCTSSTYNVNYPNSKVSWSCTGPIRIVSQNNSSCTITSTGDGEATLKATITSGSYSKTIERKLISGGYTSCMISYRNNVNGNIDSWCTSHSGNIYTIESDYDIESFEVRLKKYPSLEIVSTETAQKGDNYLSKPLIPGWYTMEARVIGCKTGNWVSAGEVEAVDCSANYALNISPNPATNIITLTLGNVNTLGHISSKSLSPNEWENYEVQIWSEASLIKKFSFNRPKVQISVSDLRNGRYFVVVLINGKRLTEQLIIK